MKIRNKLLVSLVFLTLVVSSLSIAIRAQTGEVNTPQFKTLKAEYNAGLGNDFYFRARNTSVLLGNDHLYTTSSSYDALAYSHNSWGTISTGNNPFSLFNGGGVLTHNTVYQFRNTTNNDMKIHYQAGYHDLLQWSDTSVNDLSNGQSIQNIGLLGGVNYYFQFNANSSQLLLFSFLFASNQATSVDLTMSLLLPSGTTTTKTTTLTTDYVGFIPYKTRTSGTYTVKINPNVDVLMKNFQLFNKVPVTGIKSGFSENVAGLNSQIKFFTIENTHNSSQLSTTGSSIRTTNYMGDVQLTIFDDFATAGFGVSFSGTTAYDTIPSHSNMTIAVNFIPPNEHDPQVNAYKQDHKFDKGFNVSYSFWNDFQDIQQLPMNQSFLPGPFNYYGGYHIYSFTASQDLIMNYNSTGTSNAAFVNDNYELMYLDPTNVNFLNNPAANIAIIPKGHYFVYVDQTEGHSFNSFTKSDLSATSPTIINSKLKKSQFFWVPHNENARDLLNMTYKNMDNHSVTVDLSFYDASGVLDGPYNHNFMYVSNSSMVFSQDNNTTFGPMQTTTGYYVKVLQTANKYYNGSDPDPVTNGAILASQLTNYTASFELKLQNYFDYYVKNYPDVALFHQTLTNGYATFINDSKVGGVFGDYTFQTADLTAYEITIQVENKTLISNSIRFGYGMSNYAPMSETYSRTVDGITYNYYVFEFATYTAMTLALNLQVNLVNPNNGTLSISFATHDIVSLPAISLNIMPIHSLPVLQAESNTGNGGAFLANNWPYIAGGAVVIAAAGGGIMVISRRRSSSL